MMKTKITPIRSQFVHIKDVYENSSMVYFHRMHKEWMDQNGFESKKNITDYTKEQQEELKSASYWHVRADASCPQCQNKVILINDKSNQMKNDQSCDWDVYCEQCGEFNFKRWFVSDLSLQKIMELLFHWL